MQFTVNVYECCPGEKSQGVVFGFAVGRAERKNNNQPPINMPIEISITNEEQITVTLSPVTPTGKPAQLDGVPVWAVLSGESTVIPAANGLSAVIRSSDSVGDSSISVTADADLGSGVVEIADTITVHVVSANASSLGLTIGTPVPKV